MTCFPTLSLPFFLLLSAGFFFGCTSEEDDPNADAAVRWQVDPVLGSRLVDRQGQTLYVSSLDADDRSACTGECADRWAVFYTEGLTVGRNLSEDEFGVIEGGEGPQVTYFGWPLYYYAPAGDGVTEPVGETGGQGADDVWFVSRRYDIMVSQRAGAPGQAPESYLVDQEGYTLYALDTAAGADACVADCLDDWTVLSDEDELIIPASLAAADFGTVTRPDGEEQVTYRNRPLYLSAQNTLRGDTQGADGFWTVVRP